MSKTKGLIVLLCSAALCSHDLHAQPRTMGIDELLSLADANSQSIRAYTTGTEGRRGPQSGQGKPPARHQRIGIGQLPGQRQAVGQRLRQRADHWHASLRQQLRHRGPPDHICRRGHRRQHTPGRAGPEAGRTGPGEEPAGHALRTAGMLPRPVQAEQPGPGAGKQH